MGIISDFLKRIGLKPKQPLLQAGDSSEKATTLKTDVSSNAGKEFDDSLKVTPVPSSQIIKDVYTGVSDSEHKKPPVLKVFAERGLDSSKVNYVVKYETDTGFLIPISVIKETVEGVSLKDVVGEISKLVTDLQSASSKDEIAKKQSEIKQTIRYLKEKYKINFTGSMMNMVENGNTGKGINYQKFESLLPRTIDIKSLTPAEIVQYGKMLKQRLGVLDSITTPESAYEARTSLESFMKHQEVQTAHSAIIAANLENLESSEQTLDMPTIIAFAKKLEGVSNEDGMLYSSYLKLEENRIIRQLQKDIAAYKQTLEDTPESLSTKQLADTLLDYLESTKISVDDSNKDNITSYMIDTISGKGIENYAKNMAKHDIKLKIFLQHNPIEHQEEALNYITAKMACFGQVVSTPEAEEYEEKIRKLRDFIEVTDYKDADDSEVKNFLYTIAQVEKDYIRKNYSPILLEFQKIIDAQSK